MTSTEPSVPICLAVLFRGDFVQQAWPKPVARPTAEITDPPGTDWGSLDKLPDPKVAQAASSSAFESLLANCIHSPPVVMQSPDPDHQPPQRSE